MDNFTANIRGHFLYVNSIMDKDEKCVEICYLFDYIFLDENAIYLHEEPELIVAIYNTILRLSQSQNRLERELSDIYFPMIEKRIQENDMYNI